MTGATGEGNKGAGRKGYLPPRTIDIKKPLCTRAGWPVRNPVEWLTESPWKIEFEFQRPGDPKWQKIKVKLDGLYSIFAQNPCDWDLINPQVTP